MRGSPSLTDANRGTDGQTSHRNRQAAGAGRAGDAGPAEEDRRNQDAGPERDRPRRRDQHDRGDGALDGPGGGGLMRTHGKKYRAAVGTLEPRKLYAPPAAVEQVKSTAYAKFDESV